MAFFEIGDAVEAGRRRVLEKASISARSVGWLALTASR